MNEIVQQELIEQIDSLKKELAEANKKNQLIPAYLSGLAHDIRTPMNAIMGFVELLGESELDQDQQGFYTEMITRGSKKLLNTVSNLIDFAKLETDNMNLYTERIVISELFEELQGEMRNDLQLYGKEGVRCRFNGPVNGSGIIHSDRTKLYQILKIFIDNSIKFTMEGEIEVTSKIHDKVVDFSIRDTGKGMDGETLKNVYTLFSSQKLEKGQRLKSRGLGMIVANKLVQILNGEMMINSQLKMGTTVTVSLPQ